MISFQPTEDESAFIDVAKGVAKNKIRPAARNSEENNSVDEAIIKEVSDLGFLSMELPESFGGLELPLIIQVQILQALSYGDLGVVQGLPGAGDTASLIRLLPENEVLMTAKDQVIDKKATIAFLDRTNSSEPWGDTVTVTAEDSGYMLDGISQPVRLAAFADYIVIAANDSEGALVLLCLDNDANQWKVEKGDYRLGLLASGIARLSFKREKVAVDNVIATGKEARELMKKLKTRVNILQAAKEVGLMEAALDYATAYTSERKAFGQEIAKFQGVAFRVASMAMEVRVSNHLVWQAASQVEDETAEALALRALHRAHKSLRYVTDSAVQLLGGHGFVQEFPVEKWMRDAQAQVSLYGREQDLLLQHGEQLINGTKEVAIP